MSKVPKSLIKLRASPALVYIPLYLHMWRVKMKIKCSNTSVSGGFFFFPFSHFSRFFFSLQKNFPSLLSQKFSMDFFVSKPTPISISSFPSLLFPMFPSVVVGNGLQSQRGAWWLMVGSRLGLVDLGLGLPISAIRHPPLPLS